MRKLLVVLFVLGISIQAVAIITVKEVLGDWKYNVQTDQGSLTGTIKVAEKEGKLAGEIITDDGTTIPVLKIEIKEENILYLEIELDYETIKISLKIEGKKFTGTVAASQGEVPITGEKKE